MGNHPRTLTSIVKCVKYFSYWEDGNYAHAYETCPHCGCKNIRDSFGEDDD